MKTQTCHVSLMIVLVAVLSSIVLAYSGGSGTAAAPYQIATKADLLTLAATTTDYSKYFILTANIDMSGQTFPRAVIAWDTDNATADFQGTAFTGVFDGNGHQISNLTIYSVDQDHIGLFGKLGGGGQIKRLGMANVSIRGRNTVGGLSGYNYGGTITECYVAGHVTGVDCVGGFCGINVGGGAIRYCYTTGSTTGRQWVGGFCGLNTIGSVLDQCYSANSVSGTASWIGGFCGENRAGISNCFWDIQTSGQTASSGGTGLSTAAMKTLATFTAATWTFPSPWYMPGGSYPLLACIELTTVPSVVNLTESGASSAIAAAGLFVGTVTYTYSDTVSSGCVIIQNPTSGQTVAKNSYIALVVSLGVCHYSGGSGTSADPIRISSSVDLVHLGAATADYSKCFIMTGDIDLNPSLPGGQTFLRVVIAPDLDCTTAGFQGVPFTGVFDGNGHTISNLTISSTDQDHVGFFGRIETGSTVKRLGLVNVNIQGDYTVGGLCGMNYGGTITQCYVTGQVHSVRDYAGGLCGINDFSGSISCSYANCTVQGQGYVGGFCGYNPCGTINQCYSAGSVSGTANYGGFCGNNVNVPSITNCFWDTTTSHQTTSSGGTGKTTAEMQTVSTFTAAGWSFPSPWYMASGRYPLLAYIDLRAVPNIVNLSEASAHSTAVTAGLSTSSIYTYSDTVPYGYVISQNPAAGQTAIRWSDVIIVVSLGAYHYSGGSGTASDPFQIANVADIQHLAVATADYSKYFVLTGDIDLTSQSFTKAVISWDTNNDAEGFQGIPFTGTFDGNGHTISNLTISSTLTDQDHVGLFGRIEAGGQIKRLGMSNVNITGDYTVGGLCGINYGGTITQCYVTGQVHSVRDYAGGLCGINDFNASISQCYATCTVQGQGYVGGFCGYNPCGTISQCYSVGHVSGTANYGGFCGNNVNVPSITNCFWDITTSGQPTSSGGTGKIHEDMQKVSTFTAAGWSSSIWYMVDGRYPLLACIDLRTVPNVVNLNEASAHSTAVIAGLSTSSIYSYSDTVPYGYVISQNPAAGQTAIRWSDVIITVSLGVCHYSGGSGTAVDPIRIASVVDIQHLAVATADYSKCFIMTADVNLSGQTFTKAVIAWDTDNGTPDFQGIPFTGTFDGNGHTIRNLTILSISPTDPTVTDQDHIGLFGKLGNGGQIKRLNMANVNIWGRSTVGGLSGYNYGTITECYVTGHVRGYHYVGGFCGINVWGTIRHCQTTATTSGEQWIGGFCGWNTINSVIQQCSSVNNVTGSANCVGGFCGMNSDNSVIQQCYSTCPQSEGGVNGATANYVGGFCGMNSDSRTELHSVISQCYSADRVTGTASYVGGFCGENLANIMNCFWDITTSGRPTSSGGTGQNTAAMKTLKTFTDAGWDFEYVWWMQSDSYPQLKLYCNGIGTQADPYQISMASQLIAMGQNTKDYDRNIENNYKYFVLMADIDLSGQSFNTAVIAPDIDSSEPQHQGVAFTGSFDGNGHTISNLTIFSNDQDHVGLFGKIDAGSVVKRVNLVNVNITGEYTVGGLCGMNSGGTIMDCSVSGQVKGYWYVGGLCGINVDWGTTIRDCYTTGSTSGQQWVGGVCGWNTYGGVIEQCHSTNTVNGSGTAYYIGGMVGENLNSTIKLTDNYTTGAVTAADNGKYVGDLVGLSDTPIVIEGNVYLNSPSSLRWNNLELQGGGTLYLASGTTLNLSGSTVSCNIAGTGTIEVDAGTATIKSELLIKEDAIIGSGSIDNPLNIHCNGLLHAKDQVHFQGTNITVTRSNFQDQVNISGSKITADAGSPYGQFFIEDTVHITDNEIHADGDRYMDLDPSVCHSVFENNRIYVTITEGVNGTPEGLFELRGDPNLVSKMNFSADEYHFYWDGIPEFNTQSWTIEELKLEPGAKLNLTNRFDYQYPFDSGGTKEVLYVKKLILGENCKLNTAFNRLYYGHLEPNLPDISSYIKNAPLLSFSLHNVACDNDEEFRVRIIQNNYIDPHRDSSKPDYSRTHVSRIEGAEPDPNGMIKMTNMMGQSPLTHEGTPEDPANDPCLLYQARAKALFAKASEDKIHVQFEYLFQTSDPNVELVIYLTDIPEILDHNDPAFSSHYREVARLLPPLPDQPGSMGSGRFGIFSEEVYRQGLDFVHGTRIEFELRGPADANILIDNWDPYVSCSPNYCGDVTGDAGITELDFLSVVGLCGNTSGIAADGKGRACLEGIFSNDGFVDLQDIQGWDWKLNSYPRKSFCYNCLSDVSGCHASTFASGASYQSGPSIIKSQQSDANTLPEDSLLIAGKQGSMADASKLSDALYSYWPDGQFNYSVASTLRTNGKLIQYPNGTLYQVNMERGIIGMTDSNSIVPPAQLAVTSDPRYAGRATVCVGIQNSNGTSYGRPIQDAVFDKWGDMYVVPVVVEPNGCSKCKPYLAAARLKLKPGQTPPYEIKRLYDDPQAQYPNDNRSLTNLREIEVDKKGGLYVLNANQYNDSNILWKYNTSSGKLIKRRTLDSEPNVIAPTAMHVSRFSGVIYLASSLNPSDANSVTIRELDPNTLVPTQRIITINNMGHVADITDDPSNGCLYVAGFKMVNIPEYLDVNASPFYQARLAIIPSGTDSVSAITIPNTSAPSAPDDNLALPMSILYIGNSSNYSEPNPYYGADLDNNGTVDIGDLAILASQWLKLGNSSADIAPDGGDGQVNFLDFEVLTEHWKK